MGGFGSGRWSGKLKCESCLSVDVRTWARKGLLKAGTQFQVHWNNGSNIGVTLASDDRLELRYAVGDGAAGMQSITLTQTPCNYGGHRTWFIAPCCGNRSAKLFMRRGRFACRACHKLAYQVQSLDYIQRQHRARRRVTNKLENGDKPRGMHWSTFDGLQDRIEVIDGRLNSAGNTVFAALFQRIAAREARG